MKFSDKSFEEFVKECSDKNLSTIIQNASKEHALTLFQELLDSSIKNNETVKIISGNLDDDFYNNLVPTLKDCLKK